MNEVKKKIEQHQHMKITEEKDLWIRRHDPFKSHRGEKRKELKRVKKVYMIQGIPSKESICKLLEFPAESEKIRGRRQKAYLKK